MKRYWIAIGMTYAIMGTSLSLNVGEKIFRNGKEVEVVGIYSGTHKSIPVD